jgi:Amt family ammonium transporter
MLFQMAKGMKPVPGMMVNGMLAGLVAITAPCAFVSPWAAVAIGSISGVLVVVAVWFFDARGVDDPVGAISVHGVNGLWGVLSVGIFANGDYGAGWNGVVREEFVKQYGSDGVRGILYGDASQLWMQAIDCVVVCVFGFAMAYAWFKISNMITSAAEGNTGLDMPGIRRSASGLPFSGSPRRAVAVTARVGRSLRAGRPQPIAAGLLLGFHGFAAGQLGRRCPWKRPRS